MNSSEKRSLFFQLRIGDLEKGCPKNWRERPQDNQCSVPKGGVMISLVVAKGGPGEEASNGSCHKASSCHGTVVMQWMPQQNRPISEHL